MRKNFTIYAVFTALSLFVACASTENTVSVNSEPVIETKLQPSENGYENTDLSTIVFLGENGSYNKWFLSGYFYKTELEKVYESVDLIKNQNAGEILDVYLYSKKQEKIVGCLKNCNRSYLWYGIKGWGDSIKNGYNITTIDGKRYIAEMDDYSLLQNIDGQLWDIFSTDIKVSVKSGEIKAGEKVTFSVVNAGCKYLMVCTSLKGSKWGWDNCLKTIEGGACREFSIRIPYSYDKLKIFATNDEHWGYNSCFEKTISNPKQNGRIFKIPESYEKTSFYRNSKPEERIKNLAEDKNLDNLRLNKPDLYIDEVLKQINSMGFDEYGKVTAIHDFIAYLLCYDFDGFLNDLDVPVDYKSVLKRKKTVCAGYSNLFYEMCCREDIVCEIVGGYARGYSWSDVDDPSKSNHAWNSVRLDDVWYLIDNTWDSGKEINGNRNVSCEHTWLFVLPEQMLPTHFPTNSELQLIKKPCSLREFKKLPYSYPK